MRVTVLGSGTSHGVPMIACDCAVCRSDNPKNHRCRASVTVHCNNRTVLIDTTPELRLQALAVGLNHVDAVFITHTHADHIFGMDDVRRFNDIAGVEMPVYGDAGTLKDIRRIFRYIFVKTQQGGGKPRLALRELPDSFDLYGMQVQSMRVWHGKLGIRAFRFDDFAYVTDVNRIPPRSMARLTDLKLLIIDAVRIEPHVTHYGLYEALDVIEKLKPARALITHISHRMDHDTVSKLLPASVELAYDGMVVDVA
jgi:phosphoribosyl 1,2-cyclic phosphate phosphodiesterase